MKCASCWATITHLETSGDRPDPRAGDLTVCPLCGLVSVFTGEGTGTRTPTESELTEALERPDVARAVMVADSERKAVLDGRNGSR